MYFIEEYLYPQINFYDGCLDHTHFMSVILLEYFTSENKIKMIFNSVCCST